MNIGETIRNFRMQKGMSQGDIEKRTGLLRCYLSRGRERPHRPVAGYASQDRQLARCAAQPLFCRSADRRQQRQNLPQLNEDEVRFLSQIRRYSSNLNDSDRKLVLAMVKKMAVPAIIR